jgi:hypothetical protein
MEKDFRNGGISDLANVAFSLLHHQYLLPVSSFLLAFNVLKIP